MINCKLNYCINLALLLILFGCSSGEINDSNDNGNGNGNNGNGNNGNGGNGNGGSGGDNDDETNFYLSSLGSDSNSGSQNKLWKTLSKLSAKELSPGDTVFFETKIMFSKTILVRIVLSPPLCFSCCSLMSFAMVSQRQGELWCPMVRFSAGIRHDVEESPIPPSCYQSIQLSLLFHHSKTSLLVGFCVHFSIRVQNKSKECQSIYTIGKNVI